MEESLQVSVDIDGFKIALVTNNPEAVKQYHVRILDILNTHVQTISRGRMMAETMMLQNMQDAKRSDQHAVTQNTELMIETAKKIAEL
jgi:hypothetical protein